MLYCAKVRAWPTSSPAWQCYPQVALERIAAVSINPFVLVALSFEGGNCHVVEGPIAARQLLACELLRGDTARFDGLAAGSLFMIVHTSGGAELPQTARPTASRTVIAVTFL